MDFTTTEVDCSFCGKTFNPWEFLSALDLTKSNDSNPPSIDKSVIHVCRECHDKGLDKPIV